MITFNKTYYGFWQQICPEPFTYDTDYKESQGTTPEMSWLRLGTLIGAITNNETIAQMRDWKVCDVGSGNGSFAKEASKIFGYMTEYDLSGPSITENELYNTEWDIIFLTDVLEHYEDINDLFKIKFKRLFLSFPETPVVHDWKELQSWRHYKPNEHIWMLNAKGVCEWLTNNGYHILYTGNPEDAIRKSPYEVNISTVICDRV